VWVVCGMYVYSEIDKPEPTPEPNNKEPVALPTPPVEKTPELPKKEPTARGDVGRNIRLAGTLFFKGEEPWFKTEYGEFYLELDEIIHLHETLAKRTSAKCKDEYLSYYSCGRFKSHDYLREGENLQIHGNQPWPTNVLIVDAIRYLSEAEFAEIKEKKSGLRIDEPKANALISNKTALLVKGIPQQVLFERAPNRGRALDARLYDDNIDRYNHF